ncbi:MAG: TolC family protein [Candidatus Saccharicenans sp.]|nr:TolC family protein [Candidatus Saccharicenans sp.]
MLSIFLCLLLILLPLSAETDKPEISISVEQAVAIALKQNPEIKALEKDLEIARSQTAINSALPDTELGLEIAALKFPGHPAVEQETSFGLLQNIPFPGKIKLRKREGLLGENEAALRLEKASILLSARVKKTYYRALFQQKTGEILLKNLEFLEEIQKNAISKYPLQTAGYRDLIRLKLEMARTKNDLIQAQKELAVCLQELVVLLGLEQPVKPVLTSRLEFNPEGFRLEEFTASKKQLSPTLRLAKLAREKAELNVKQAGLNRLPDFSFGLFSPSKKPGATGFSFGLSYPLFAGKRISGERTLAEAERQKAGDWLRAVEKFYESRVNQVTAEIGQCLEQMKIFEENLLKEIAAELEKALEDYRLGRLDYLNLLDLFRNSSLIQLEYYRTVYLFYDSLAGLEAAGEDLE